STGGDIVGCNPGAEFGATQGANFTKRAASNTNTREAGYNEVAAGRQSPQLAIKVRESRIVLRMLIMSFHPLGANELKKNYMSTMEVLPNHSEGTAGDLHFHQLVVVPASKSIFISRLSSFTLKKAIAKYVSNKLVEQDAKKCSIFKFCSARQRDFASLKIIFPTVLFEHIMTGKFWARGLFIKEFLRRQRNIARIILEQSVQQATKLERLSQNIYGGIYRNLAQAGDI
uniref:Uncharacterized protein n=1 Tax=Glossina palpalis gambiensis TaxID=67801 RepID=A0A1B0C3N1_9MUSC